MRKLHLQALSAALLILFICAPSARPQNTAAASVEDRRKALNAVFQQYWEDDLEHSPEFASTIGDKRYNNKISDYSVKAENEQLAREQAFLLRLAAIDTAMQKIKASGEWQKIYEKNLPGVAVPKDTPPADWREVYKLTPTGSPAASVAP